MNIKEAKNYLEYAKYEETWLLNELQTAYIKAKTKKFKNDNERIIWIANYIYNFENSTAH
jgi:hypothetical protein|tara:strand:- start:864 stop:1043 length:180 start_codon:yes stop_codon:yes gene_type:complete